MQYVIENKNNFANYSNNQGSDMAANNHIQDEIILYEGGSEAND